MGIKITCDACGADITFTGNSCAWRLKLGRDVIPVEPGLDYVTDMFFLPPMGREDCYFCGMHCLDRWRDKQKHKSTMHEAANSGG